MEINDVFNYLGIDSAENLESFREKFENEFVKKSVLKDTKSNEYKEFAPTFVGKVTGSTQTALNRKLKEYGIELDSTEIQGKRIEDVIELGVGKLAEGLNTKIIDLEGKLSKGKDEATKEIENKFNSVSKKYSELENAYSSLKNEYQQSEETWKGKLKNEKLSTLIAKSNEGIKWKAGIKDIEREGYFSRLKNNYKIDLDENTNSLEVFDVNGNRIPNPKKSGTWKTYQDILEEEGIRNEVWATNDHANKMNTFVQNQNKVIVQGSKPVAQPFENGDGRVRKVSGRLK